MLQQTLLYPRYTLVEEEPLLQEREANGPTNKRKLAVVTAAVPQQQGEPPSVKPKKEKQGKKRKQKQELEESWPEAETAAQPQSQAAAVEEPQPAPAPAAPKAKKQKLSSKKRKKISGPSNAQEAQGLRERLGIIGGGAAAAEGAAEKAAAPAFSFGFQVVKKDEEEQEEELEEEDREEDAAGEDEEAAVEEKLGTSTPQQAEPIVDARTQQRLERVRGTGPGMGCARRVFAAGMPFHYELSLSHTQEEDVRECWSSCGEVESLDLMRFPDTQRFRGIAFITFKTEEGYRAALEWDGELLEKTRLKVEPCKEAKRRAPRGSHRDGAGDEAATHSPAPKTPGYHVAYVGNLDYGATDAELREVFGACGATIVRIHTDAATGRPKGYAHVHFPDEASLDKAVALDGTELLSRRMKVGYAQPKKQA